MNCINKSCKSQSFEPLDAYVVSLPGGLREAVLMRCKECHRWFSVAGAFTTKKAWKAKIEKRIAQIALKKSNENKI